jgi:hypothetical protein
MTNFGPVRVLVRFMVRTGPVRNLGLSILVRSLFKNWPGPVRVLVRPKKISKIKRKLNLKVYKEQTFTQ